MAKRKLNSGSAQSRKRTKLDGPQHSPRTRRAERSSPSLPRASSSLATADAGQGERSKRKRTNDLNDDSSKDSSKEPAAKRARTSQSPGEPSAEAGPSTSQGRSAGERSPLRKLSPRTRASRSVPVGTRAKQEEEAADGEESGSESISSERCRTWSGLSSPDPNYVPPPDRSQSIGYLTYLSVMETIRALDELSQTEPFPPDSPSDTEAHWPRRPRGPLGSPPQSPPPALQQEQPAAMPASVDAGAGLLFENSLVAAGTRAEQEEEAADGEESGSESISSERRRLWPGVILPGPDYVEQDRPNITWTLDHYYEDSPTPEPEPYPQDWVPDIEAHGPRRPRGPRRSRGPIESPPQSPPPALQQEQPVAMLASVAAETGLQEEEAVDGEESGIASERLWPGVMETVRILAEESPTPGLLAKKKTKKTKKTKKAKKAKKADKTQDQNRSPPAVIENFLRSRRSTRRDKGRTLWCLGDNGAARPVASRR